MTQLQASQEAQELIARDEHLKELIHRAVDVPLKQLTSRMEQTFQASYFQAAEALSTVTQLFEGRMAEVLAASQEQGRVLREVISRLEVLEAQNKELLAGQTEAKTPLSQSPVKSLTKVTSEEPWGAEFHVCESLIAPDKFSCLRPLR